MVPHLYVNNTRPFSPNLIHDRAHTSSPTLLPPPALENLYQNLKWFWDKTKPTSTSLHKFTLYKNFLSYHYGGCYLQINGIPLNIIQLILIFYSKIKTIKIVRRGTLFKICFQELYHNLWGMLILFLYIVYLVSLSSIMKKVSQPLFLFLFFTEHVCVYIIILLQLHFPRFFPSRDFLLENPFSILSLVTCFWLQLHPGTRQLSSLFQVSSLKPTWLRVVPFLASTT